jgi:dTDP-4-amino-4,6-dideoxygalactose transaminase
VGSSFLPSELTAAFLYAQLEKLDEIQNRRKTIWQSYWEGLTHLQKDGVRYPTIPDYATNNAHMFYLVFPDLEKRTAFIAKLRADGIMAVFHYQSLHKSEFFLKEGISQTQKETERYSDCLVRMPFYYEIEETEIIHSL